MKMKKIGFIPLRKGSKGIKGKNKRKLVGRPLYTWVLNEAILSDIDEVFVYTDDDEIIYQVNTFYQWCNKIKVLYRSDKSATDTASTESAMLEFSDIIKHNYDIIVLLQATSPLTTAHDINSCINKIANENFDSALSVVQFSRFTWSQNGESLNYNYNERPRRQDFKGNYAENGAVYVTKKDILLTKKNRLGGRIGISVMPEDTYFEIDEKSDWIIIEKLIENRLLKLKKPINHIKAFVFDVDGVFTDGKVGESSDKELFKTFSLRDGMGFELLKQEEIIPVVITSEDSSIVKNRMNKLKIEHVFLNIKDKFSFLDEFLIKNNLQRNQIAYIGDDINDSANLASAGWSFCPKDAVDSVKSYSDIVLHNNGGNKAIREAIEFIIKLALRRI